MSLKTYHGSCSCGKVRYEVKMDLSAGTFKCNCTVCTKSRLWGAAVKKDAFRLTSGENDLAVWGEKIHHLFCRHCGVKMFGRQAAGGDTVVIPLGVLDDLEPEEWAGAPVKYIDGRREKWSEAPVFTAHL